MDVKQRIKEVSEQLEDLKERLPAHSLKPSMWEKVEDLEEELARLRELDMKKGE